MEKRTLLAISLSLAVLYVWSVLFPAPRPKPVDRSSFNAVKAADLPQETQSSTRIVPFPIETPTNEDLATIETSELKLIFSNIGGQLKQLELKKHPTQFPDTRLVLLPDYENAKFTQESLSPTSIRYSLKTPQGKITKEYTIEKDNLIKVSVFVQSEMSRVDKITISSLEVRTNTLPPAVTQGNERSLLEYSLFTPTTALRKGNAVTFNTKDAKSGTEPVELMAFRDHYFCVIVKPEFKSSEYSLEFPDQHTAIWKIVGTTDQKFEFSIYGGQQNIPLLKSYDKGFEKVISFSNFPLFDGLAKFFYWVFIYLHKSLVPNWGLCIIIVGILIYAAVYPLTMRGMDSMRKMQQLQPEMAALREKHKNNPQKLNKEVMELYKAYKINPLSGCFTFILQMPIFIGIYQVLWRSPMFKGEGFLWIKDLTRPDQLMILPQALPIIGKDVNLLPVIMAIIMFFQQKISMKSAVVVDPAQAMQQKMMLIFFPIFLGFIFYKFASGLVLYFTIFYALSALTQYKMSKLKKVEVNG